jgi:disulfide bond formation protein DsbB
MKKIKELEWVFLILLLFIFIIALIVGIDYFRYRLILSNDPCHACLEYIKLKW